MHPLDFQPLFQKFEGDPAVRRERVLNSVVDYRFLAPHKIAADELRAQELTRAALSRLHTGSGAAPSRSGLIVFLCYRLGAALVAAGTRLQRHTDAVLSRPAPMGSPETRRHSLAESPPHASTST